MAIIRTLDKVNKTLDRLDSNMKHMRKSLWFIFDDHPRVIRNSNRALKRIKRNRGPIRSIIYRRSQDRVWDGIEQSLTSESVMNMADEANERFFAPLREAGIVK